MAENSISPQSRDSEIEGVLKSLRPLLQKPLSLGVQDVSSIIVSPVLQALGWNSTDPRQVRRDADGLRLLADGKTVLSILCRPILDDVPSSLQEADARESDWIVATNGSTWRIFHRANLAVPFRSVSIRTIAESQDAVQLLSMLGRQTFQKNGLSEAWMAEAIDHDIERVLARHLDGSPALVAALKSDLAERGITIPEADILASLSRLDISVTERPVAAPVRPDAAPAPAEAANDAVAETASALPSPAPEAPAPEKPVSGSKPAAAAKKSAPAKKKPERSKGEEAVAAALEAANEMEADLPSSLDEAGWPKGASHGMQRKKNVVFFKHSPKSGQTTILPGSLIVAELGKALNPQAIERRQNETLSGSLVPHGSGMLKVVKPVKFPSPRNAMSFAAATLVKNLGALVARPKNAVAAANSQAAEPAPATEGAPAVSDAVDQEAMPA